MLEGAERSFGVVTHGDDDLLEGRRGRVAGHDLVVGEELVQDVGFVAVLRAELMRLKPKPTPPPDP